MSRQIVPGHYELRPRISTAGHLNEKRVIAVSFFPIGDACRRYSRAEVTAKAPGIAIE
jgi:hypothetical protein